MEFRVVQAFAGRKRLLVNGEIICVSGFVFGVLLFSFFSFVVDFHMVFPPPIIWIRGVMILDCYEIVEEVLNL